MITLLTEVIVEVRRLVTGIPTQGLCGFSRDLTYYMLRCRGVPSSRLWVLQAATFWYKTCHAFLVMETEDGSQYLVDLTASQFLSDSKSEAFKQQVLPFLTRGYLNLKNIREFKLYRILVGAKCMDAIRNPYGDLKRLLNRHYEDELDFKPEEIVTFLEPNNTHKSSIVNCLKSNK